MAPSITPPGGRGAEIHQLPGGKHLLQLRLQFGVKVFETLAAMPDHGRAKRLKRLGADFNRARNVQFDMCHKI